MFQLCWYLFCCLVACSSCSSGACASQLQEGFFLSPSHASCSLIFYVYSFLAASCRSAWGKGNWKAFRRKPNRRRVKATYSLTSFAYLIKLHSTKSTPCCYERKIMHVLILYCSHCFSQEKWGYCNSSLVEICKPFTHLVHGSDNPCSWDCLFISY